MCFRCRTALPDADTVSGQRVRCPRCKVLLTNAPAARRPSSRDVEVVEEGDEDDTPDVIPLREDDSPQPARPSRPRRKRRARPWGSGRLVLSGVLLALFLLGAGIAVGYLFFGGPRPTANVAAPQQPEGPAIRPAGPGVPAVGKIDLADWVGQVSFNREWEDRPLSFMTHNLRDGVLTMTNDCGIDRWSAIVTRRRLTGDYTIRAEVKNAKSVGLKSAFTSHAWAGTELPQKDEWHTVVITRKREAVSITVDGHPVRVYDENSRTGLDPAVFYFHIWANTTAAFRSFVFEQDGPG
jgi:hypothetical protein